MKIIQTHLSLLRTQALVSFWQVWQRFWPIITKITHLALFVAKMAIFLRTLRHFDIFALELNKSVLMSPRIPFIPILVYFWRFIVLLYLKKALWTLFYIKFVFQWYPIYDHFFEKKVVYFRAVKSAPNNFPKY